MTSAWLILLEAALLWVFAYGITWAGVRIARAAVARSHSLARNYRGAPVAPILGLAWLFWFGGASLFEPVFDIVRDILFNIVGVGLESGSGFVPLFARSAATAEGATTFALAVLVVGLVDDVWGDGDAKGIRGHLRALRERRVTTGALKVMGIGLFAAVAASSVSRPLWGMAGPSLLRPSSLVGWLLATVFIAGMANLVNLLDLRPVRALKVYGLLVFVAALVLALTTTVWSGVAPVERVMAAAFVLLFALGPAVAVWRLDAREQGMLGDAGANAFGFVAGVLLVHALPSWGVALGLVPVVGLNMLAERVSFTAVIEGSPLLRWLDGLGRERAPSDESPDIPDER